MHKLSKRESARCYRNTHFIGPGLPFVEANITDIPGSNHTIVRELKGDESLVPRVDRMPKSDLREFGIDTMYDGPLILLHTLQDFIFMKPKGRYEMLSAMLGLEPLMTFRNTVESGKTEFNKRIPPKIREGVLNVIRGKNAGLLRRGYSYGALGREITPDTPTPSIRTLYVGVSTPPGPTLKKATGSGSTE